MVLYCMQSINYQSIFKNVPQSTITPDILTQGTINDIFNFELLDTKEHGFCYTTVLCVQNSKLTNLNMKLSPDNQIIPVLLCPPDSVCQNSRSDHHYVKINHPGWLYPYLCVCLLVTLCISMLSAIF